MILLVDQDEPIAASLASIFAAGKGSIDDEAMYTIDDDFLAQEDAAPSSGILAPVTNAEFIGSSTVEVGENREGTDLDIQMCPIDEQSPPAEAAPITFEEIDFDMQDDDATIAASPPPAEAVLPRPAPITVEEHNSDDAVVANPTTSGPYAGRPRILLFSSGVQGNDDDGEDDIQSSVGVSDSNSRRQASSPIIIDTPGPSSNPIGSNINSRNNSTSKASTPLKRKTRDTSSTQERHIDGAAPRNTQRRQTEVSTVDCGRNADLREWISVLDASIWEPAVGTEFVSDLILHRT